MPEIKYAVFLQHALRFLHPPCHPFRIVFNDVPFLILADVVRRVGEYKGSAAVRERTEEIHAVSFVKREVFHAGIFAYPPPGGSGCMGMAACALDKAAGKKKARRETAGGVC